MLHNQSELVNKLNTLASWDFTIEVPNHKCESCEKTKDVELAVNPYLSEIHGETEWEFLCEDCYGQMCADI